MTEQFVLTLDSEAAERLKRLAAQTGQSLEEFARDLLQDAAQTNCGACVPKPMTECPRATAARYSAA